MSRKTQFYISIFLVILITLGLIWIFTRPQSAPVIDYKTSTYTINYEDVNQSVYDAKGSVCLFFYSSGDNDSVLVIKNMLETIKKEYSLDAIPRLYYVDLKKAPANYTEKNWNFAHYPTFLVMSISDSKIYTKDILEWDPTNPYSASDVKTWLKNHNLIGK